MPAPKETKKELSDTQNRVILYVTEAKGAEFQEEEVDRSNVETHCVWTKLRSWDHSNRRHAGC